MTELSREEVHRVADEIDHLYNESDLPSGKYSDDGWLERFAAVIYEAGAKSERAVSDRLLDALKSLDQAEKDGIHFCASGLPIWEKARATLAEVEAMRKEKPE